MSTQTIESLIDRIRKASESAQNEARKQRKPAAIFGIEEPIGWVRLFNYNVEQYCTDPEFYFQEVLRQKLWRWENFPNDGLPIQPEVPAWLGGYCEYTFIGLSVSYDASGVPVIQADHPMTREPDLRLLKPVDFKTSGMMPRILRWYDDLKRIAGGRVNVPFNMLWGRGCLDLAVQLRGYENFMVDTAERPAFVHDLLQWLVEQRCRWWDAYYQHFGLPRSPVPIADDWLNVPFIRPAMFSEFVLPRYLEIEKFHGGIQSIHSCGNQTPIQRDLLKIKSLVTLENSPWTDLAATVKNVPPEKHLAVSLHPNDILFASRAEMLERLETVVSLCRGRNYTIYTSGLTPINGTAAQFVDRLRTWTDIARDVLLQCQPSVQLKSE